MKHSMYLILSGALMALGCDPDSAEELEDLCAEIEGEIDCESGSEAFIPSDDESNVITGSGEPTSSMDGGLHYNDDFETDEISDQDRDPEVDDDPNLEEDTKTDTDPKGDGDHEGEPQPKDENKQDAGPYNTYFVSPNGNDSNIGTEDAPFATLERARDAIRVAKDTLNKPLFVVLLAGTYFLDKPFVLGSQDSGTKDSPITYQAKRGHEVVLSGGSIIDNWTLYDRSKNIYKATLPKGTLFRQLYANNYPQIRARQPNRTDNSHNGPYYKTMSAKTEGDKFYRVKADYVNKIKNPRGIEFVAQPTWYHQITRISSIQYTSDYAVVRFMSPEKTFSFNKPQEYYSNNAFHLENSMEFLDAPQEWFLNPNTGELFYVVPKHVNINDLTISYPRLDSVFVIKGSLDNPVHDIVVKDLILENTNWTVPSLRGANMTQGAANLDGEQGQIYGVVDVNYAQKISIQTNVIRNAGRDGLIFGKAVKNSSIIGNVFQHTMANGIAVDRNSKLAGPELGCDDNRIENNIIRDIAMMYSNGIGLLVYFAENTQIKWNDILYTPYMGTQVGNQSGGGEQPFGNNKVFYNHIHHVMRLHDDGGAIYTLSPQRGTHVFENYIHDVVKGVWAMKAPVAGLYADNRSAHITWENNVLNNCTTREVKEKCTDCVWKGTVSWNEDIQNGAGLRPEYRGIRNKVLPHAGFAHTYDDLVVETENMVLSNYNRENRSYSSGSARVAVPAGQEGRVDFAYDGLSGKYDITIGYISEPDGDATHRLLLNDKVISSWTARSGDGGRVHIKTNVNIRNGDIVSVTGKQTDSSHARLDYVYLRPHDTNVASKFSGPIVEVEDMKLTNYTLEGWSYHSGRGRVKVPVGKEGRAEFPYSGESGKYDISVAYVAETDGQSTHRLYLNGQLLTSWTARSGDGNAIHTKGNVTLKKGDKIVITGKQTAGSHARLDYVYLKAR